MISNLVLHDGIVLVHLGAVSLKATKSFTHGSILFDLQAQTIAFGKLHPVPMPAGHSFGEGMPVSFQLIGPDGVRRQIRTGLLRADPESGSILRIAGKAKTERKYSAAEGWTSVVYKYRAYCSSPGLAADFQFPDWINGSVQRQRTLWNRLAYLCREARRQCSPVATSETAAFIQGKVLPAIDLYNETVTTAKGKIRHPVKLKGADPDLDDLWKFAVGLRYRLREGRAVPPGLLELITTFAGDHRGEYTPIKEFFANFAAITKVESSGLKHWERKATIDHFQRVLNRRKSTKCSWYEGWPRIKYRNSPDAGNWALHYYLCRAGIRSSSLDHGRGVPGLTFGLALEPSDTGHRTMTGLSAKRSLREAQISIRGLNHDRWLFSFRVLQHRPLPPHSHLKEWKLIYKERLLWLCLVVEVQRPLPAASPTSAELAIGWRSTGKGGSFGSLHDPATRKFHELTINLQESSSAIEDRINFRINFGPTRWEKRNILKLCPDWRVGNPFPAAFDIRTMLENRRTRQREAAKILLNSHLDGKLPPWIQRGGGHRLRMFAGERADDPVVQEIVSSWRREDDALGEITAKYFARTSKRLEDGQTKVANDICAFLIDLGILHLIVKDRPKRSAHDEAARAWFAATSKFTPILKFNAAKFGIVISEKLGQ